MPQLLLANRFAFANVKRSGSVSCHSDPGGRSGGGRRAAQNRAITKTGRSQGRPSKRSAPMQLLSVIAEIIRDLLIFVAVMTGLLVALIVVVSKMPDDNPLKRLLTALTYRVGATAAAGALAIPVEPIPGIDAVYDFAVPILLIWYWFTFFRDAWRMSKASAPHGQRQIAQDGR
jgi:hypothetical protein